MEEPASSPLRLRVLGGFQLTSADGVDLSPPGKKLRALIALLALAPAGGWSRERLTAFLWGDRDEEQARGSLRQALAELRRSLGESALQTDRDTVAFNPGVISVDTHEFTELAAVGEAAKADALYSGDLLDGVSLPDAEFADWLLVERTRLHDIEVRVLGKLLASQSGEQVARTAQRLLHLEPVNEGAHRALMRYYWSTGDRAHALRQFQPCRESLHRELGIEPSVETEDLYHRIQQPPVKVEEPSGNSTIPPLAGVSAWSERPRSSQPSVAVLPFTNLSDEPGQEYFSDGITEDIIVELSRYREILVIARNSSFHYREKPQDLSRISQELGVEYIVDGSLRKAGTHLRVSARLLEAATGRHLWAERYDREMTDVFLVQDEVSQTVASTLAGQIVRSYADRVRRQPTENWAAYDYVLQARESIARSDIQIAEVLLHRAIEIDPRYALAFGFLANVYLARYFVDLRDQTLQKALAFAQEGLLLNDEVPFCQCMAGAALTWSRQFELAEMHHDRAIALNPNGAYFIMHRASLLTRTSRPTQALAALDVGALRDPHLPAWYWEMRSTAFFVARRYPEAIKANYRKNALQYWDHAYLAAANAYLGRDEEAHTSAVEVLRLQPDFSIRTYSKLEPYEDPSDFQHLLDGFRKAGLPE